MTILINRTPRALPTRKPDQDITAAGCTPDDNPDLFEYKKKDKNLSIVLESASGTTVAFEKVEIELSGYIEKHQKPTVIWTGEVDSARGKILTPMTDKIEMDYISVRQANDSNPIGPTAGAFLVSSVPYPHSVAAGENIIVSVDGSANQTSTIDAGDVADITSITFAEEKALFEADLSGVTLTLHTDYSGTYPIMTNDETVGIGGTLQVMAASTADAKLGFDNVAVSGSSAYNAACKYQLVYDDA